VSPSRAYLGLLWTGLRLRWPIDNEVHTGLRCQCSPDHNDCNGDKAAGPLPGKHMAEGDDRLPLGLKASEFRPHTQGGFLVLAIHDNAAN
jgi:hypothetical protein